MRKNVNSNQNIWINGGQVDSDDLTLEQQYVNDKLSSLIDNHIGSGALPDSIVKKELFNSESLSGDIDGIALYAADQPSDDSLGNQIEIVLSSSNVFSLRTVKIALFGLDFENNIFYETFSFSRNESQISKKHYKKILTLIVNDISGPSNISLNLGGSIKIYEAGQATISRDCIVQSQNIQPNLFWRDFFVVSHSTLNGLLSSALVGYDISSLNIFSSENDFFEFAKNDIVTEIGQKFKSKSNNIQKIRLLLSVENNDPGDELDLEWNGNLVITLYKLQSTIQCSSDLAPNLDIEFDPINTPIAQISLDFNDLKDNGFVLSNSYQPVDFVFSNSTISKSLQKDSYYIFTLKRSGVADKCDIKIYTGQKFLEDSRISIYNGNYWSDIQTQDLWFEIYSDSAKVTSGNLYEDGFGIQIEKTITDELTNVTSDYCLDNLDFIGNSVYTAIVTSQSKYFDKIEDKRTGSQTNSKQTKTPEISLLNEVDLSNYTSSLFKIGVISDKNKKFQSTNVSSFKLYNWSFIKNEILIPLITDTSDPRYSADVLSLKSSFLNGELFKSKIIPDTSNTSYYYRIGDSELLTMVYGDFDGNCIIDETDLEKFTIYEGFNLNVSPKLNSSISFGPLLYNNGYLFLTNKSVSKSSLEYYIINTTTNTLVDFGTDGVILPESNSNIYSQITSPSGGSSGSITSQITSNDEFIIYIVDTESGNNGFFEIREANSSTQVLRVSKKYLDSNVMMSLLRCNINGDFLVDADDGYLIESYIQRDKITSFPTLSYPAPTSNPYNKIGTTFEVLRLKLEKYEDFHDDQYSSDRSTTLHPIQDLYIDNTSLRDRDISASNISSTSTPKLVWEDYLVVSKSKIKYVPNVIIESSGDIEFSCADKCKSPITYPQELDYDCGVNNYYIPNNLIIGDGQIINKDKTYHKIDFEVGTILIEVPDNFFGTEKTINIFSTFVSEYNNSGKTISGFKALKFADCTYVQNSAILNNQVKFSASVQSFSPVLDGYDLGVDGVIVDPKMGVYIDYTTGLLRLNFTNIYKDLTKPTLSTKIQINVFLKKSGFNNDVLTVSPEVINNLFI